MCFEPAGPVASDMKKSQILVVDDHPMVRDWLAQLIRREPDLAVCGEAGSAAALPKILGLL